MRALLLLILTALVAGCGSRPADDAPPTTRPTPPPLEEVELSHEVRTLLRPRMGRHARDLGDLFSYVRARRFDETARIAALIAAEPRIARPLADAPDTLNATIPPAFFAVQDALQTRARDLAAAARAEDAYAVDGAFEGLAATCAACHTRYVPVGE